MYQFFVEEENISGVRVRITGSDVNHIRAALRMKPGERIRVSSPAGLSYYCRIESMTADEVAAVIEEEDTAGTEAPCRVYLFQGLPKGDKMELVIQKAVELGVHEIVPVAMKNCVVKLDLKKTEGKMRRWQAVAESAAKQSKRTRIPQVHTPVSWEEALALADELDVVLVPYEHARGLQSAREAIGSIREGESIGIVIGPEGGFAGEEIDSLPARMRQISLGPRILRTETAGPAVLAMLVYALEE